MSHATRISTAPNGDMVLTVTVTGAHDIVRFASGAMYGAQCEFSDSGIKVLGKVKARLGAARWNGLHEMLYGRDHVCGPTRCVGGRARRRTETLT